MLAYQPLEKLPDGPPIGDVLAGARCILIAANRLFSAGEWLRPAGRRAATTRDGEAVHPTHPQAHAFHVGGAIVRVSVDFSWQSGLCAQRLFEMGTDGLRVSQFNDAPWVTREVIEDAFMRAIWRAQNPHKWKSEEWANANGF